MTISQKNGLHVWSLCFSKYTNVSQIYNIEKTSNSKSFTALLNIDGTRWLFVDKKNILEEFGRRIQASILSKPELQNWFEQSRNYSNINSAQFSQIGASPQHGKGQEIKPISILRSVGINSGDNPGDITRRVSYDKERHEEQQPRRSSSLNKHHPNQISETNELFVPPVPEIPKAQKGKGTLRIVNI